MNDDISPSSYSVWGIVFWVISVAALIITAIWCHALGQGNLERSSLAFALCAASFAAGSIFGFVFTIFGDEQEPLRQDP